MAELRKTTFWPSRLREIQQPAIGYAAMEIVKKYGDGIMCIFPSDHFIKNEPEFTKILNQAVQAAEEQDKLITIGIAPTFPSTGYGYIKFDKNENAIARKVEEFKEKPDYETAKTYVESGNYAWTAVCSYGKHPLFWKNLRNFFRIFMPA